MMAKMLILLALFFVTASSKSVNDNHTITQEIVDYINSKQKFFKARLPIMSHEQFKLRLMDAKYVEIPKGVERKRPLLASDTGLPESFDARERWPECVSIRTIRDQTQCGSCWAVSGASVMSDRLCIQSNGRDQRIVSDTDILACCTTCSTDGNGCHGGHMLEAFQYAMYNGVCTGGAYGTQACCKPYPFYPCGRRCPRVSDVYAPTCLAQCQPGYNADYFADKIYATSASFLIPDEQAIQAEIYMHGPVQAGFDVYQDFETYNGIGVYVYSWGYKVGGHAVKIIGWGVENGVKYWLISNSYGPEYGENGVFKMRRGTNECNIESLVGMVTMAV